MQALFWDGRRLAVEDSRPAPEVDRSSALVRVHYAGICATDLQIFKGYMDFRGVPGHEFVGTVLEGPEHLRGRRVVAEINYGCQACEYCGRGLARHCPNRRVMGIVNADGAFAEYVAIPLDNLHLVPEGVEDREAVFVEPLAAAFEILEQVQVDPGDDVLIVGDGKLGILCAQVLKLTGAKITVIGKHPHKLSSIKRYGIRTAPAAHPPAGLFDTVVEATGSPSGMEFALRAVRPRGTLVMKTTIASEHRVALAPLVINEITIVGSRCGPFAPALASLAEGSVSVQPLIEAIYPLGRGLEAVEHASKPGTLKILLEAGGPV